MKRRTAPRVVVVGGGFAGLHAALDLAHRAMARNLNLTLIDRDGYHLFTPLLYEAATGIVQGRRLTYPLEPLLRSQGVEFVEASVRDVDLDQKFVDIGDSRIPFDYVALCAGSETSYYGRQDIEASVLPLKTVEDAERLLDQTHRNIADAVKSSDPSDRRRLLTLAVIGAGATGVELAASFRHALQHNRSLQAAGLSHESRVLLVEAKDRVLPGLHRSVSMAAANALRAEGIDIRVSSPVVAVDSSGFRISDEEFIPAATVVWTAGITAVGFPGLDSSERVASQRLRVDEFLRIPGRDDVFAAGDIAGAVWKEGVTPANAPAASQMGKNVARNIVRSILQIPLAPFCYDYPGDLIALGNHNAVARIGRRTLTGPAAWAVRRAVYLTNVMGAANRIGLAVDWFQSERGVK